MIAPISNAGGGWSTQVVVLLKVCVILNHAENMYLTKALKAVCANWTYLELFVCRDSGNCGKSTDPD